MVKLGQLQSGDIVIVSDEGLMSEGTVLKTNAEEHWRLWIMGSRNSGMPRKTFSRCL